jgi:hypothetical protein
MLDTYFGIARIGGADITVVDDGGNIRKALSKRITKLISAIAGISIIATAACGYRRVGNATERVACISGAQIVVIQGWSRRRRNADIERVADFSPVAHVTVVAFDARTERDVNGARHWITFI